MQSIRIASRSILPGGKNAQRQDAMTGHTSRTDRNKLHAAAVLSRRNLETGQREARLARWLEREGAFGSMRAFTHWPDVRMLRIVLTAVFALVCLETLSLAAEPGSNERGGVRLRIVAGPTLEGPSLGQDQQLDEPAESTVIEDEPIEDNPIAADEVIAPDAPEPTHYDRSASQSAPLTAEQLALRDQIRQTLAHYYHRPVNARDHSPWEAFHWVIAYNVDAQIYTRGPGGETANAVAWLCYNYPCAGQRLLSLDRGLPVAKYGVGLEGHPSQFLAILAQSRVMIDYPLRVNGRQFTVADLVESSKLACDSKKELTFQLIALSHYLDLDATWKNRSGQTWSIPRLIREEIASPIRGSACGGTHRLMGLTYCVKKRQQRGQPIDGEYLRAKTYVDDYINFTLRMQNPDGSFSTEWFAGRGARPDVDRRIQTTGHILEWMVFAANDEQLHDRQIVGAVDYLSKTLLAGKTRDWKIGPLGHAIRSLSLYDRRVFKPLDEPPAPQVARRERSSRRVPAQEIVPAEEPKASAVEIAPDAVTQPFDPSIAEPAKMPASESIDETGPLFIVP
jgi:hypothetical protein